MTEAIASPAPRSRVKVLVATLGLVLVLGVLRALMPAWGHRGAPTMPDELLGVWRTTARAYRDRALEIKPETLIVHAGGAFYSLHPVRRVVKEERGWPEPSTVYTVEYEDGSEVATLSFEFVRAPQPTIWLQNRTMPWLRKERKEKN